MNKPDYTMAYDIFERSFADDISWQVEVLLEVKRAKFGDVSDPWSTMGYTSFEEVYDAVYEEAILIMAEEKGLELV